LYVFFSSRRRHTSSSRDWSSDVCSSDLVATIGVGTHFAIVAAVVHTLAHALFKSSLFMLAGTVDHQAGTRDIRRLGPLWRRMPRSEERRVGRQGGAARSRDVSTARTSQN